MNIVLLPFYTAPTGKHPTSSGGISYTDTTTIRSTVSKKHHVEYRSVIFLGYCLNCTPCWIKQFDSIGTTVARR